MQWIRARLLLYFALFSLLTVTQAYVLNATEVELLHTKQIQANLGAILSRNNAGLLLQGRGSDKCRENSPQSRLHKLC